MATGRPKRRNWAGSWAALRSRSTTRKMKYARGTEGVSASFVDSALGAQQLHGAPLARVVRRAHDGEEPMEQIDLCVASLGRSCADDRSFEGVSVELTSSSPPAREEHGSLAASGTVSGQIQRNPATSSKPAPSLETSSENQSQGRCPPLPAPFPKRSGEIRRRVPNQCPRLRHPQRAGPGGGPEEPGAASGTVSGGIRRNPATSSTPAPSLETSSENWPRGGAQRSPERLTAPFPERSREIRPIRRRVPNWRPR